MTQEREPSYEEALLALSIGVQDEDYAIGCAKSRLYEASPRIRAALARGPQGEADRHDDIETGEIRLSVWTDRIERLELELAEMADLRLREYDRGERFKGERDAEQSRALAAEARVKELESKLTDTALVDAGWSRCKHLQRYSQGGMGNPWVCANCGFDSAEPKGGA